MAAQEKAAGAVGAGAASIKHLQGQDSTSRGGVQAGAIPDWLAPILERLRRNDGAYKIKGGKRARFKPERAPTEDEIADHFNGGVKFVGGYLMDIGSGTTRLGVVDLDDHDGALGWDGMQQRADVVIAELIQRGLRAARFRSSGGCGVHLWLYWEAAQDARSVRIILRQCVTAAGLQVKAGVAEVFPAQDFIPEDACGTPVFWPVERLDAGDWLPSQAVPIKVKEPPPERPHVGACSGDLPLLRLALRAIPNEGPGQPYGEGGEFGWLTVGMALNAASGGRAEGLGLWHEWSGRSPKYDAADVERRWSSFKPGGGITAATILKEAARYGFNEHQARLQILAPRFQTLFPAQAAPFRTATEDQVEPLDLWQERPPRKFTADLMPPVLGDWAAAQARVSGLDPAGFAFAALAAAAGAVPGGLRVRPDAGNPSWRQPALLWVALVGETGTGKTPCIEAAVRPLVEVNRRLMERYKWALAVQADAARGQPKGTPKPKLPQIRALAHDVTIEKLGDILESNSQGLLIVRDELTAWLNGMGQYKARSGERGDWLSLWNGNSYAVDRISRGSLCIPFWGASILGGIQPARIAPAVQDGLEDGMLPRFLIGLLHPDNLLPRESVREINTLDRFYSIKLQALRGIPAADVSITDEAAALFDASCQDMRDIARHLQYLPALQVFLHKWPNLLARVALVFHAIDDPRAVLSGATMTQALGFAHFALNHQQRFYERMSSAAPAVALGREVALVLLAKKLFPLRRRELQRYCRHWLDADDGLRREAIHWLQDCGWLMADISQREQRRGYAFGDGTAWEVNPLVAERFEDLGTRESARRAEAFQRLQRRASDLTG